MISITEFIKNCPTPYQSLDVIKEILDEEGYIRLDPADEWGLKPWGKYYTEINGSSLIAFRTPKNKPYSFMITASHNDSPGFRLKENLQSKDGEYIKVVAEPYGGMVMHTWIDRPLSVAGRISLRTESGFALKNVDLKDPCCIIPGVAIHLDPELRKGISPSPLKDMVPIMGLSEDTPGIKKLISGKYGIPSEDILSYDLYLYEPSQGTLVNDLLVSPRLDDLACAYSSLSAFLASDTLKSIPMYVLFNNEEVGSLTMQGAAGTFLADTMERISGDLSLSKEEHLRSLSRSFMLSCDNAHALHPNHPELSDKENHPVLNKGIVIKANANMNYATDAVSGSVARLVCERASVPYQFYYNRSDIRGGTTLGNIALSHAPIHTADIGIAQLSMHSAMETCGLKDISHMTNALRTFFETSIVKYNQEYILD